MKVHPVVEAMREARKARGWSVAELARRAGTTANTVSRWETGESSPMLEHLTAVLATLGSRVVVAPAGQRVWLLAVETDTSGRPVSASALHIGNGGAAA